MEQNTFPQAFVVIWLNNARDEMQVSVELGGGIKVTWKPV